MKKILKEVLMLILLSTFVISCQDDGISAPNENAKLEIEIDRICDSVLSNTLLPGMIIGVWDNTRKFSYVKGHGFANIASKKEMKPDMYFRIGSNTKSFVVTVILQLVDEKKISLNDKLSKFYPDFPNADKVTIKMLCDMTSGIYNYTESDEFGNLLLSQPLHKWTPKEMMDIAANHPYYFEPGTSIHYSNTNTAIIGAIIENLENKPLGEVLKHRLLTKYNLTKTIFAEDSKMPDGDFVSGYANFTDTTKFTDDVSEMFDLSWAWAAGSMISDIYDAKKWVEMLIDGGMISDSLQTQRFDGMQFPGANVYYSQAIYTSLGTDMWGHNGGLPGYTSIMMRHKTLDKTIIIFYNWQANSTPDALFLRIEGLLR